MGLTSRAEHPALSYLSHCSRTCQTWPASWEASLPTPTHHRSCYQPKYASFAPPAFRFACREKQLAGWVKRQPAPRQPCSPSAQVGERVGAGHSLGCVRRNTSDRGPCSSRGGASLGTALAGLVLVAALTASFLTGIAQNPAVPKKLSLNASVELAAGIPFVSDA